MCKTTYVLLKVAFENVPLSVGFNIELKFDDEIEVFEVDIQWVIRLFNDLCSMIVSKQKYSNHFSKWDCMEMEGKFSIPVSTEEL